jgi:hypothetical protein
MMSMTPTVAHRNTNKRTPMRRSHKRALETDDPAAGGGADGRTGVSGAGLISPRPVDSAAKGSLGSDIIAGVVVRWARESEGIPGARLQPTRAFYDFRA